MKCQYCGNEIVNRISSAKYCSYECKENSHKDNMRMKYVGKREASCVICGSKLPKFKTRYCSDFCRIKAGHIKSGVVKTNQELTRQCVVCGKEFHTWKGRKITCSDKCSRKKKENDRQYKGILIDSDISLFELAEKCDDVCQLCGLTVDWSDYEMKNGQKICGNMYPSIDHIKPISRGGLHSWENVQLAHRVCNSRKCNKFIG